MTIDTKELRMLAQDFKLAGSPMFLQTSQMNELLDRLEAAESDALEQARLNGMGAERELALMAKLEAAKHALHQVSLGSQIAMSSQRECARIARAALEELE